MRILVLSATVGGGHMAAANALKDYVLTYCKEDKIAVVDAIQEVDPTLNKIIVYGYKKIVACVPKLFYRLYKSSNKKSGLGSIMFNIFYEKSKKLKQVLKKFKPDVIICTHPFCAQMVSMLKRQGELSIPSLAVLTDYEPHQAWINHGTDAYITAHDKMKDQMEKMGALESNIFPFGIPVNPKFFEPINKHAVLKELNLSENLKTILIMAGSFGIKKALDIYDDISYIRDDFQIIVITGKNQKLYEKINRLIALKRKTTKYYKPTKLIKFTNKVNTYMAISDLLITKPGGLTISEALAVNLPMALYDAIPGQEEANKKFLLENHMAVDIQERSFRRKVIKNLLNSPTMLYEMKKNCIDFDKSKSCEKIIDLSKKLYREYKNTES